MRVFSKIVIVVILIVGVIYNGFSQSWDSTNWINNLVVPVLIEPLIIYLLLSIYLNRFDIFNDEKSRIKLSDKDLIEKYKSENFINYEGVNFPACILFENNLSKNYKVHCHLEDKRYELPSVIIPHLEGLLKLNKKIFNSITMKVEDFQIKDDGLHLYFSYGDYISYSVTNNSADIKIGDFSIREHLEPGPKLLPLKNSQVENHLGLSVLVFTLDGYLIVANRGSNVASNRNTLAPSISGGVDLCNSFNPINKNYSLYKVIEVEKNEELVASGRHGFDFVEDSIICLGLTRELRRLGKPEIFFKAVLNVTKSRLLDTLETNSENKSFSYYKEEGIGELINNSKTSAPLRDSLILFLNQ